MLIGEVLRNPSLLSIGLTLSMYKWAWHRQSMIQFITPLEIALKWRHNGRDGVSNHQAHDCLLNSLFRRRSKKTSLAFERGIHRWPLNSPHKRPVTRKMFPFDDVIMPCVYETLPIFKLDTSSKPLKVPLQTYKTERLCKWTVKESKSMKSPRPGDVTLAWRWFKTMSAPDAGVVYSPSFEGHLEMNWHGTLSM